MKKGDEIKAIRNALKINQAQLAELVGLKPCYISDVEKNKRSASMALCTGLFTKLKVSPNWFFLGIGEMFLPEKPYRVSAKIEHPKQVFEVMAALENAIGIARRIAIRQFEIDYDTQTAIVKNYAALDISIKGFDVNISIAGGETYSLSSLPLTTNN